MTGQTYRRTFNTPGNYSYFCTLHPDMVTTVTVIEASTQAGATDPGAGPIVSVAAGSPQQPTGMTPEESAIIIFLFVAAAAVTGGLGMLARRLLAPRPG